MVTVTATILIGIAFVSGSIRADNDPMQLTSTMDNACIDKPCGPLVCQARCVAACLDAEMASNATQCVQSFCNDFNDNSPCAIDDTECWKNCGFGATDNVDSTMPTIMDDLQASNSDSKSVQLQWTESKDASLYLLEVFPMFGEGQKKQDAIRTIQKEMTFSFDRPDPCVSYMIRVVAVNGFGISSPRYLVVDAWKPELHFDENFDVRSIRHEGDYLKVLIDFTRPEKWSDNQVDFENSFVRAHKCLGTLDEDSFLNTEPDENDFYQPLVFINETKTSVELNFPAKIMDAKCLFSYRVGELQTACNTTAHLNTGEAGVGANFALNCASVENSDCQSTDAPNIDTTTTTQNNPTEASEVVVVANPEALKELEEEENSETTAPTSIDQTTPDATAGTEQPQESGIAFNPEALKELEAEEAAASAAANTTTSPEVLETTTSASDDGVVIVVADPEALKELEQEKLTTPSSSDETTSAETVTNESGSAEGKDSESQEQEATTTTDSGSASDENNSATETVSSGSESSEKSTETESSSGSASSEKSADTEIAESRSESIQTSEELQAVRPEPESSEKSITESAEPLKSTESTESTEVGAPEFHESSGIDSQEVLNSGENAHILPPAPHEIAIEPTDLELPVCKLMEFDAEVTMKTKTNSESDQNDGPTLTIAWVEDRPESNPINPSYFLVRYGTVPRTLLVDSQPDMTDGTITLRITRVENSEDYSEEISRVFQINGLTPNGLYAFQVCAVYAGDPTPPWETAPKYVVDLSAPNADGLPTLELPTSTPDSDSSDSDNADFMKAFMNAMSVNGDGDQQSQIQQSSNAESTSIPPSPFDSSEESEESEYFVVNLPTQAPPVLNIDVKPIIISPERSWSSARALWFFLAMGLLVLTLGSLAFFVLKRSRSRRRQFLIKQQQFPTISTTQTAPIPVSEVKVPMP